MSQASDSTHLNCRRNRPFSEDIKAKDSRRGRLSGFGSPVLEKKGMGPGEPGAGEERGYYTEYVFSRWLELNWEKS